VSLLRDANAKVINVAEECGFNHLGLFNTCFKRRFGTSPGQWRKSTLRSENVAAGKLEDKSTCPLHYAGLCPFGGHPEAATAEATASHAGELLNGKNVLEDIKKRALVFGTQSVADFKGHFPEARGGA
jgi:hypothetical protein